VPADIDSIDDWPARNAYESGADPVTYAEGRVAMVVKVHLSVVNGRAESPGSFPVYSRDLSDEALARRILGGLLAIGWTPPDFAQCPPSVAGFMPPDLDHLDDEEPPS
jgi:hypothetical protein